MDGLLAVFGGALFIIVLCVSIIVVASGIADLMIAIDKFFDDDSR